MTRLGTTPAWKRINSAGIASHVDTSMECTYKVNITLEPIDDSYSSVQDKVLEKFREAYTALTAQGGYGPSPARVKTQLFDKLYDAAETIWLNLTDIMAWNPINFDRIAAGSATYCLRRRLSAHFRLGTDRTWEFHVEGFTPRFVGHGKSIAAARDNWRDTAHSTFQRLVRRRPFQMTEQEKQDWSLLEQLIDVEYYRRTTPLRLRALGWVSSTEPDPWEITWIGNRMERVTLGQMPPEFAAFTKDQWFEAIVERDPQTFQLLRVVDVQRREPLRRMSREELEKWWNSLPRNEIFPVSDIDLTTL